MSIVMIPPEGQVPFKRIKLSSTGREVFPDRETGKVKVLTPEERDELIVEGYTVETTKSIDSDTLRKIMQTEAQRNGIGITSKIQRIANDDLRRRAVLAELRHGKHDIEDPLGKA